MFKKMVFVVFTGISVHSLASQSMDMDILLQAATQQNNAEAQWMLGEFYFSGTGVKQDFAQAKQWYEKSAQQNNPQANYALGSMYANGQAVTKSTIKAMEFFQASCKAGYSIACSAYQQLGQ